jgi:hypothetical protein
MKQPQALDTILFLDIETVPETTDFTQLDKEAQDLYAANRLQPKSSRLKR